MGDGREMKKDRVVYLMEEEIMRHEQAAKLDHIFRDDHKEVAEAIRIMLKKYLETGME